MRTIFYLVTLGASVLVSCNESGRNSDNNLNEERNEAAAESNTDKFDGRKKKDADFVYEVIGSGYSEIKMAELANQRSRTGGVKDIAQNIVADRTASLNELKTLAQAKAISIPVEEPDDSRRKLEKIAGESGDEFDREWCKVMMDLHEKDIDRFEDRLEDTKDEELKAFISKTLPVLKKHHDHLKSFDEKLKGGKNS